MTASRFIKAAVDVVLVGALALAGIYAGMSYAGHLADLDLASAIFGNMDACKTAPVGEWQKASDFPANK